MKALVACHAYPPFGIAGVERMTAQTAEGLRARGHEVTVLTRRPSGAPPTLALERATRDGVSVVSVTGGGVKPRPFPDDDAALEGIFERTLIETEAEVVLITHLMHHAPGYAKIAHRFGVPVLLELHDFFSVCPRAHLRRTSGEDCRGPEGGSACATHCFAGEEMARLRWPLRSLSFRSAVRRADVVLAPSRFLAEELAPLRSGLTPIQVLANAVADPGPVLRSEADHRQPLQLVSIGVTVEHKGFQVVVEALRRAALPASYTILGRAVEPEAKRLREAAAKVPDLELRLFGAFSPRLLPALLAEADAAVVPSIVAETYSLSAREAFVSGVPVIASRIGAMPEAIRPGDNGWLFAAGDASDLAALLQRLDGDRALLARARRGIRSDDAQSPASRLDRLEALLRATVAQGPGESPDEDEAELRALREAIARPRAERELTHRDYS